MLTNSGPSSNIALMRHIFRAMAKRGDVGDLPSPSMKDSMGFLDSGIVSSLRPISAYSPPNKHDDNSSRPHLDLNVLPSDAECHRLIRDYFSNTGVMFPYIHETAVLETYEKMKAERLANVRRTWLALLNMIFAMATGAAVWTENAVPDRAVKSELFYSRALGLCKNQILRGTSLETGESKALAQIPSKG
jgi:hypothetical protein